MATAQNIYFLPALTLRTSIILLPCFYNSTKSNTDIQDITWQSKKPTQVIPQLVALILTTTKVHEHPGYKQEMKEATCDIYPGYTTAQCFDPPMQWGIYMYMYIINIFVNRKCIYILQFTKYFHCYVY